MKVLHPFIAPVVAALDLTEKIKSSTVRVVEQGTDDQRVNYFVAGLAVFVSIDVKPFLHIWPVHLFIAFCTSYPVVFLAT